MKFGKRLKQQIEQSLPGWREEYLSYKELKKVVRLISSGAGRAEAEFMYLLNNEMEKFNAFFMEKEEDFIIRHKELGERIEKVVIDDRSEVEYRYREEEMEKMRRDIVNFHGEMVLLINYSNINYTGLGKIVKKYDKRSGGALRVAFIQKVVQQPFFATDLISKLVKECETTIDLVFPPSKSSTGRVLFQSSSSSVAVAGQGIFRNTVAALLTMQEIRRGSSTYTHFSLPPLNLPDFDVIQSLQLRLL
ncbi:hypothetical protein ACJIZ3_016225 [Penstemon smallii]|uniref:SPX domain-containing protein n=1 Tax=Penstemon smallii TaxID=265156 RepID=A0ABD3RS52_9LAMI